MAKAAKAHPWQRRDGEIHQRGLLIGYARVSTLDQNLALQQDALTNAGCEKIFIEQMSGAVADRPGLHEALDYARSGDTLVVWKLDRLAARRRRWATSGQYVRCFSCSNLRLVTGLSY